MLDFLVPESMFIFDGVFCSGRVATFYWTLIIYYTSIVIGSLIYMFHDGEVNAQFRKSIEALKFFIVYSIINILIQSIILLILIPIGSLEFLITTLVFYKIIYMFINVSRDGSMFGIGKSLLEYYEFVVQHKNKIKGYTEKYNTLKSTGYGNL